MVQTLGWFFANGCELQSPDRSSLEYIYSVTDGEPCTECNCKATCPAWPKVHTIGHHQPDKVQVPQETNAQIAARLGISSRQVAKRRAAGEVL